MNSIRKTVIAAVTTGLAVLAGMVIVLGLGADWRAYTVQGGSMEPNYHPGDLIITSKPNAGRVEPGQVIVFTADWASEKYERRVVHRVAAVGSVDGRPIAFTRGDANAVADPEPVDLANNVRVVQFTVRSGGLWLELLALPLTIAVVAALGLVMAGAVLSPGITPSGIAFRRLKGTRERTPTQTAPVPGTRALY